MCVAGATTYTNIHFHKYNHDLPALSVYASIITNGAVHFETTQQVSLNISLSLSLESESNFKSESKWLLLYTGGILCVI